MRRQETQDEAHEPTRRRPLRVRWQQWRIRREAARNARLVASARWRDDDRR
jgi:hypothetical protein